MSGYLSIVPAVVVRKQNDEAAIIQSRSEAKSGTLLIGLGVGGGRAGNKFLGKCSPAMLEMSPPSSDTGYMVYRPR